MLTTLIQLFVKYINYLGSAGNEAGTLRPWEQHRVRRIYQTA